MNEVLVERQYCIGPRHHADVTATLGEDGQITVTATVHPRDPYGAGTQLALQDAINRVRAEAESLIGARLNQP